MLRALEWRNRWGDVSVGAWADKLARPALLGAAAALLARAQPLPGVTPFAWALLAAAMVAGVQPVLLLLGCASGALTAQGFRPEALLGTAAVAAGAGIWALARRWLLRRDDDRTARRGGVEAACALLAGAGVLVSAAALAAGGARESLVVVAAAVAAAVCAPLLSAVIDVRASRRHLMPEERAGLFALLGALTAGLAAVWEPLAVTAALAGSLILTPMGPGAAACCGLYAGGAMLLAGGDPVRVGALGLCGVLTGLTPPGKRWAAPLTLTLSAFASALLLGSAWTDGLCALAACALTLALPDAWSGRLRQWLAGESRGACDPDRLATRLRGETGRQLRALSAAFGELAEGYRLPVELPDEQTLIGQMRQRLCEGCSNYAQCWAGDDNRAVRFLCQLVSEAIDWAGGDCAEPLFGEEIPPDVMRICRRGRSVPARLEALLEDFARLRRSEMKRSAVNQLISAQFTQARLLLGGMAEMQLRPMRIRGRQAARARAALDRAGIETGDVMALRGVHSMEIVAALSQGRWTQEQAARASVQLSRVFGRAYAPAEGAGGVEMRFVRLAGLRASASSSCHSRQAGLPSGDSHMIRMLEGDRLLMMISDGMGSGEDAARESAQTLRLLWQFLSADVSRTVALETVNELMLARSDADMFATVDLCLIDLSTGMAEFTKLSACRSLILRKGEILEVEGGRLPLGILEKVQPSVCRIRLEPGDVVLMGSDGVMDVVDGEIVSQCLTAHGHQPPEMLAETVVNAVERRVDGRRRDDMTALCARIVRRRAS